LPSKTSNYKKFAKIYQSGTIFIQASEFTLNLPMDFIKRKTTSIKHGVKDIHTKKPYLELIAAALTIPVLLTVIILNVNNLKGADDKKDSETEKTQTIVITQPAGINEGSKEKEVIVTKEACKPGIGDVEISSPEENEEITENPVEVNIDYEANGYCAVVWSYRVNGGGWSSYDDSAISLFNLTNGAVKLELRVKSVVDSSSKNITRNFTYTGASNTPTITPTLTPTPTQ